MNNVDLNERPLAQNIEETIPPAIGLKLGAHVEGVAFVEGENIRYNIRKGMDLSIYNLHFNKVVEKSISSDPCIAITILLEASGEGTIIDPQTKQIFTIPHRGGLTYICVMNTSTSAHSTIPKNTHFYGIDIRLTPEFIKNFKDFPAFSTLTSSHRLYKSSSDNFWVGYIQTSRETLHNVTEILATVFSEQCNDLLLESYVLNILSDVISLMKPIKTKINNSSITLTNRDKRLLIDAQKLMLNSLSHPWKISELALKIGLNEKKLKAGFRSKFGIPVYRFLQRERLRLARKILEKGKTNITETSLMIGYANASHFAYLFRREFGCSPSEIKNH